MYLSNLSPVESQGAWKHFVVPMSDFDCPDLGVLNKIDFMVSVRGKRAGGRVEVRERQGQRGEGARKGSKTSLLW